MKKNRCKHNTGYTEGYICRTCKKPIYTQKQAREVDKMREIQEAKQKLIDTLDIEIEAWMKVHEDQQRTFTTEEFINHLKNRMGEV